MQGMDEIIQRYAKRLRLHGSLRRYSVQTRGPIETRVKEQHWHMRLVIRRYTWLSIASSWVVGRAIAQAISRQFPNAAARVRSQVRSCGICSGQRGTGAGFLRLLRFLLRILMPPNAPHSSIVWSWHNRPISGRRTKRTQSYNTQRN
jgi:hypothetical protein